MATEIELINHSASARLSAPLLNFHSNKKLVVWWYGGVRKNPRVRSLPHVRVFFREMLDHGEFADHFYQEDVGITSLGQLRIGSIWEGNTSTQRLRYEQQRFTVQFGAEEITSQSKSRQNLGEPLWWESEYSLPFGSGDRSNVALFRSADQDQVVCVPALELFARGYGRAAEVNRILCTYPWPEVEERLLLPFDAEPKPDTWGVKLPLDATNDDAAFLAHLTHDPYTISVVKRIYAELELGDDRAWKFPTIRPWFRGKVTLILDGIWLDDERTRFLGLRIKGFDEPQGPELDVVRVNPGKAEQAASDDAPETSWRGAPLAQPSLAEMPVGLTDEEAPDHGAQRVEIQDDRFEMPSNRRRITLRTLEQAATRSTKTPTQAIADKNSAAEAEGVGKGVGSAKIHTPIVLESRGALLDICSFLKDLHKNYTKDVRELNWYTTSTGFISCHAPEILMQPLAPLAEAEEEIAHRDGGWLYFNPRKMDPRGLLIARATTELWHVFFLELQRRITEKNGEEPFSGLVVRTPLGVSVDSWLPEVIDAIRLEGGIMHRVMARRRSDGTFKAQYRRSSAVEDYCSGQSTVLNAFAKVGLTMPRQSKADERSVQYRLAQAEFVDHMANSSVRGNTS